MFESFYGFWVVELRQGWFLYTCAPNFYGCRKSRKIAGTSTEIWPAWRRYKQDVERQEGISKRLTPQNIKRKDAPRLPDVREKVIRGAKENRENHMYWSSDGKKESSQRKSG